MLVRFLVTEGMVGKVTVYYTNFGGQTVHVWLTGAEMTFRPADRRAGFLRAESDLPLDFAPVTPGGHERIAWAATPETEDTTDACVTLELPKATTVIITDLSEFDIEGDAADLEIVDMRG